MDRHTLTTSEWESIEDILRHVSGIWKSDSSHLRKFIEAVIWIARTGTAWADIPPHFGSHDAIRQRFVRWAKRGIWAEIFAAFQMRSLPHGPLFIDATICKVHRSATGVRGGADAAIGRSRGGLTTKIHASVDEDGQAVKLVLTPGEAADCRQFSTLINGETVSAVVADRAYDTNEIRTIMEERDITVCIPTKRNRKVQIPHDKTLYAKRHVVENFFLFLKDWCRVTTRRCKSITSYMGFVHLAAAFVNKRRQKLCS